MKRSKGINSKHSRNFVSRGKATITRHLHEFNEGDRVRITPDPAYLKGRVSNLRFKNVFGVVKAKRGKAYEIEIKDGGKKKVLLLTNLHLTACVVKEAA